MSEEFLDLVKCCPVVDERAGKAVAQIVNAHVLQAKFIANSIPFVENASIGVASVVVPVVATAAVVCVSVLIVSACV